MESKNRLKGEINMNLSPKEVLLQKVKDDAFSIGSEFLEAIKYVITLYSRILFVVLFLALLDKADYSIPMFEGIGDMGLLELANDSSQVLCIVIIFQVCIGLILNRGRWKR
ncbi:hypothetical protein J7E43_05620 [Bacillus sp. ISL-8]|nr:hypothetical protein [Bacillus sp. ISL-8]